MGADNLTNLPLAVDLDRSIVRTDVGVESLIALLVRKPWMAFVLPFCLLRGLAFAKRKILNSLQGDLDFESFPENTDVMNYVRAQAANRRKVMLVTASDSLIAIRMAERFGCFSEAIGSDGLINLKGSNKARYLVERFGARGFAYLGDSHADLAVWKEAGAALVVDYCGGKRTAQAENICKLEKSFSIPSPNNIKLWIKQLRVHQWAKNLLLFLPLILAHQLHDVTKLNAVVSGTIAFCLIASIVYILNDLSDLATDRRHPLKNSRPLASGQIKIESALIAAAVLAVLGCSLVAAVVPEMAGILACYFVVTCLYTWWAKEQLGLDVMILAALYCIRIIAGGVAANVELSQWLLSFAGFLFLSLGCAKRVAELTQTHGLTTQSWISKRRAYLPSDLSVLTAAGVGAGLLSVLVCALYFSGADVTALYKQPEWLFVGVLPVFTYWILRLWLIAGRGGSKLEDPVQYAITDPISILCGALSALLVWCAI